MGWAVKRLLLATVCAAGLCGCGTANNLNNPYGKPAIYGGVRRDLNMQMVSDCYLSSASGDPSLFTTVPLMVLSVIDLPLSAVCDTLTLPLTIRVAFEKDAPPGATGPKAAPAAAPSTSPPAATKQ